MNTRHRICKAVMSAAGLACAVLLAALLTPVSAAAAVGLAVLPILGTPDTGITNVATQAGRALPQVLDVIDRYDPGAYPVTTLLDRMGYSVDVHNVHVRWQEEGPLPRHVVVNGAMTAGAAGAAKTITVDSRNAVKPADILVSRTNATDATRLYKVTGATSTTLTLKALPKKTSNAADIYLAADSFGTVPAFADDEVLYWLTNAKSEEDAASQPAGLEPAFASNFVHTFDLTMGMSDHELHTLLYGTRSAWSERIKKLVREFRLNREGGFVMNEMKSVTSDTNLNSETKTTWTMTGLRGFITEEVTIPANPTMADLVAFGYNAYNVFESGNGLTRRKILFAGRDVLERLDMAAANTAGLRWDMGETLFGVEIMALKGRMGRVDTVHHPLFDLLGLPDEGLLVNMGHIGRGVMAGPEPRDIEQKRAGAGVDRELRQMISKETLVCRMATGSSAVHKRVVLG